MEGGAAEPTYDCDCNGPSGKNGGRRALGKGKTSEWSDGQYIAAHRGGAQIDSAREGHGGEREAGAGQSGYPMIASSLLEYVNSYAKDWFLPDPTDFLRLEGSSG
jgi:hypothetical protein